MALSQPGAAEEGASKGAGKDPGNDRTQPVPEGELFQLWISAQINWYVPERDI